MKPVEHRRDSYLISTDRARLDLGAIQEYLSCSYWAQGRSLATIEASIEHSLCFGLYAGEQQVGFARVVTDYATFGWLCDVYVLESHRGRGLGKWLVRCVVAHPALRELKIFLLATSDAHELYRRYGSFEELPTAEKWMARSAPER